MDEIGGDPGASFPANGMSGLFDSLDRLLQHVGQRIGIVGAWRTQGMLSSRGLLLALFGLLLLPIVFMSINRLLLRFNRVEANFRGERIPQSFGLAILAWSSVMLVLNAELFAVQRRESLLWLLCVIGFGLLGFVDDTWGTEAHQRLARSFSRRPARTYHYNRLCKGRWRRDAGVVPRLAVGSGKSLRLPCWHAALIALSANAINLLDLRPGRAGGVFLLLAFPLCFGSLISGLPGTPLLLFALIPALLVWQRDSRAQVMMGDTGSNLLGATLGLSLATPPVNISVRLTALLLLLALHILAERLSLTKLIEQKPFCKAGSAHRSSLKRWKELEPNTRASVTVKRAEREDLPTLLRLIEALADFEKLAPPDSGARQRLEQHGWPENGQKPLFTAWLAYHHNAQTGEANARRLRHHVPDLLLISLPPHILHRRHFRTATIPAAWHRHVLHGTS